MSYPTLNETNGGVAHAKLHFFNPAKLLGFFMLGLK